MGGLIYQLKSVWKDKFCIMSFLLPVIVALALRLIGGIDLSSVTEFHFGVLEGELSERTLSWLEGYGSVTVYETQEKLSAAVNDPATNLIGVEAGAVGIETMVSGDEIDIFRQTADTLPALYAGREKAGQVKVTVLERPDVMEDIQNIFAAMTLIIAMFMGCTFNAMNMISEKENGVDLVNQIMPVTQSQYVMQKIFVGFAGGCLSALFTAGICFRLPFKSALFMLALIMLSAFVAALIGLFIGKFSGGLMVGVVYIKILMIVFMAFPLLSWLLQTKGLISALCCLVPSNAAFEGIMKLAGGGETAIAGELLILMAHCMVWLLLYGAVSRGRKK